MARSDKKKKNTVRVDFTGVEAGSARLPEAGYRLKVVEAKLNDDRDSIIIKSEVLDGDDKAAKKVIGKTVLDFFNLQPQSLWRLRQFLDALGLDIPEDEMDLPLDELTDMEYEATAYDDDYDGRTRTKLRDYVASGESSEEGEAEEEEDEDEVVVKGKKRKDADDEDEEDEDEKPSKKSKKSKKKDDEDEDEEETEEEEEEKPSKKSKKSKKDEDEEEEEDEDEPKSKKKSKKGASYTEDEVRDMDEKELKALVKKHDLDVDLDDYTSTRKKAMAIVDALEEAGLLESE